MVIMLKSRWCVIKEEVYTSIKRCLHFYLCRVCDRAKLCMILWCQSGLTIQWIEVRHQWDYFKLYLSLSPYRISVISVQPFELVEIRNIHDVHTRVSIEQDFKDSKMSKSLKSKPSFQTSFLLHVTTNNNKTIMLSVFTETSQSLMSL